MKEISYSCNKTTYYRLHDKSQQIAFFYLPNTYFHLYSHFNKVESDAIHSFRYQIESCVRLANSFDCSKISLSICTGIRFWLSYIYRQCKFKFAMRHDILSIGSMFCPLGLFHHFIFMYIHSATKTRLKLGKSQFKIRLIGFNDWVW